MVRVAHLATVGSLLLLTSSCLAQPDWESRGFTGDTKSLPHPVQLPPAALALLTSDKEDFPDGPARDLRCNQQGETPPGPPDSGDPKPELLCTAVKLSSKPGTDYLVLGSGGLLGAHALPFWVIHQDPHGVSLLFTTRADGLSIRRVSYHGYREVEVDWILQAGRIVTTKRYRFTGKRYTEFYSHDTHH